MIPPESRRLLLRRNSPVKSFRVNDNVLFKLPGLADSVEFRRDRDNDGRENDGRLLKNEAFESGGASGRWEGPLLEKRRSRPRLGAGEMLPSYEVAASGEVGRVREGLYSRIEHQFLRLRRRLLFLGLPSTSCVKIGIMSSSVSASKWCTLLRLLRISASMSGGGALTMAEDMMFVM